TIDLLIRGRAWASRTELIVPLNNMLDGVVNRTIAKWDGSKQIKTPKLENAMAQGSGYWPGVLLKELEPNISEEKDYPRSVKDAYSRTVLLYANGGCF
ncbi:hypothetical protein K469DRAFT_578785, partial [Zopfia rhizophila CBS 207.26]